MMFSARTVLALVAGSLLASGVARAGDGVPVSGQVRDESGLPIAGVLVNVVELSQVVTTDSIGHFAFAALPAGRYLLSARRIGYAAAAQSIVVATAPVIVRITLVIQPADMEPVNVTALRAPIPDATSPLPTSVLTGDEIHRDGGVSLAHSIARLPGVRNVSTGQQVGKPMIRGLFGPRVLVLTDGSRLEDYSWSDEDGPSLDARLAQRIEVIRGPASVLYGSDAISGVVNVIPAELSYANDGERLRHNALELYGGSNNLELGGALLADGASSRRAWRLTGTGRFSQNVQTPSGALPNSSFWSFNGEGAYGMHGDRGNTTIRAAHYGGEFHLLESNGPETGDPNGGPVRQILDDRLQVTNDHVVGGVRFESKAQLQRHALTEVSDDCVPAPGQTSCTKVKDQQAFGLVLNTGTVDLLAHHGGADLLSGTLGVSGMYQTSNSSGPIFLVPSATIGTAAAFAFERLDLGRLAIVAGARGDSRHLAARAQPEIARAADNRSWSSGSGDVGFVLDLTSHLALLSNVRTGWRAPTLFDLYANGPNLAEARYEIGDPTLKLEHSRTYDGGARWASEDVRAELSLFRSDAGDFIFTTPTSATVNGLRVYRHMQSRARLAGGELSLESRLTSMLSVRASHDVVRGDDRANGVPLPLMPPPRSMLGATLELGNRIGVRALRVGGDVEIDQRQTRLNPNDYATSGYTLLNLDASFEREVRLRPVRFDLSARNVLNTTYHDYLSRFKEFASGPGVNVILKASLGAW